MIIPFRIEIPIVSKRFQIVRLLLPRILTSHLTPTLTSRLAPTFASARHNSRKGKRTKNEIEIGIRNENKNDHRNSHPYHHLRRRSQRAENDKNPHPMPSAGMSRTHRTLPAPRMGKKTEKKQKKNRKKTTRNRQNKTTVGHNGSDNRIIEVIVAQKI